MKYWGAAVLVGLGFLAGIGWDHLRTPSAALSTAAVQSTPGPTADHSADAASPAVAAKPALPARANGPAASLAAAVPVGRVQSADDPCPPHFEPPVSSTAVAAVLEKYASCYLRDDSASRKDHFTPVADRFFEMEERQPGWADIVEEKAAEVQPQLSTVSVVDGACRKDICRYTLKFNSKPPSYYLSSSALTHEFMEPLQAQITGLGYNAHQILNVPRAIRWSANELTEFKVYVFRTDVPADYLKPLSQLFELSDEQLGTQAGASPAKSH